jgi:hypothetical protein
MTSSAYVNMARIVVLILNALESVSESRTKMTMMITGITMTIIGGMMMMTGNGDDRKTHES